MSCSEYSKFVLEGLEVLLMKLSRLLYLDKISRRRRRCQSGMENSPRCDDEVSRGRQGGQQLPKIGAEDLEVSSMMRTKLWYLMKSANLVVVCGQTGRLTSLQRVRVPSSPVNDNASG